MSNVLCKLALLLLVLSFPVGAMAHEAHGPQGQTVNYSNWVNGLDKGCCNNQDCKAISDENVKYSPRVEVKIEGKWCPVLAHHYLKKGNAPDWSTSHVCVQIEYYGDDMGTTPPPPTDPCGRLLCFQPKPLF